MAPPEVEHLDVLDEAGTFTGISKPRSEVHRNGDYHRAVHVWIYAESTRELLLQKRAHDKDTFPDQWDISCAGHISAGETSLATAIRELKEELGITLPPVAFELIQEYYIHGIHNDGAYINKEFNDVYLVTTLEPIPLEAFTLQESEVSAVKYMHWEAYGDALRKGLPEYVPYDLDKDYNALFNAIKERYNGDEKNREEKLKEKLARYKKVPVTAELSHLGGGDRAALPHVIRAAQALDRTFLEQVSEANTALAAHLTKQAEAPNATELDKLKRDYFLVNKSPWSILDEGEAFLSTADSPIMVAPQPSSSSGSEGVRFRAAFPQKHALGANFYPSDLDRKEFEAWKANLTPEQAEAATGFFAVIRRPATIETNPAGGITTTPPKDRDLQIIAYSEHHKPLLAEAAGHLRQAAELADTPSLKKLLGTKADAFMSNDYYDSDLAWMDLDSPLDVTIGPYETYMDELFSYKATFEAFIGVRDDDATAKVKLFSDYLQELEDHLPLADEFKVKGVSAAPIRVIQLAYNSGDVRGPQTAAFNLPNDEQIVKARGTAMVLLKNIMQAKFDTILEPIAGVCVSPAQRADVGFEAFFTHILCHECCHGIGPHSITTPDGRQSTVRLELQELHAAIEEAKADIVGLWALQYLLHKGLLPADLGPSVFPSFLAGCFRSVRFGVREAHGRGQALQFNFILEKGGVVQHSDGTFSVDHEKMVPAVEALSREILTLQAHGDKARAQALLDKYGVMSDALTHALACLREVQVPTDIVPLFNTADLG